MINTYILLDEEEYRYLQNNDDFMELMKSSKFDMSLIKISDESKKEMKYSEKLVPKKNDSPTKSPTKQRKSFRDMFFPVKERTLEKIDENEELVILRRQNSRIKSRLRNIKLREENYENSKELLVPNPIFLTAIKGQESLYNEFQKGLMLKNTRKNNATMLTLVFITLIKLLISLGIRNDHFIKGTFTFGLVIAFLIMMLLFILVKDKFMQLERKYYTYPLLFILIFGIIAIIIENHYSKSDIFDKVTLLHIMSIILFGSRLK